MSSYVSLQFKYMIFCIFICIITICKRCSFSNKIQRTVDSVSHLLFFQPYHSQAAEARCTNTDTCGPSDSGFSSEGEGHSVFNFKGILLLVSQKPKTSGILDDKGLAIIIQVQFDL